MSFEVITASQCAGCRGFGAGKQDAIGPCRCDARMSCHSSSSGRLCLSLGLSGARVSLQNAHLGPPRQRRCAQDPDDQFSEAQLELRRALALVIPFRASNFMTRHEDHRPAGELSAAMRFADACASALMGELQVEGIGAGLTIQIQGRVKSLYSTHRKMQLKGVPIEQVRPPQTGAVACSTRSL